MRIRPGSTADARHLAELHVRTWKSAYPGLVPQSYLDALEPDHRLPQWEEALAAEPWPEVLVLEDEGAISGFCSFGPPTDEDLDPGEVGELYTVYLDPWRWRRGGGRLLVETAADHLRAAGFRRAVLWTLGTNAKARGFYEHLGWALDGATKVHDWGAFVATDVRYARQLA